MYLKTEDRETTKTNTPLPPNMKCAPPRKCRVLYVRISFGNRLGLWHLGTVRKNNVAYLISVVTSALSTFFVCKETASKIHEVLSYKNEKINKPTETPERTLPTNPWNWLMTLGKRIFLVFSTVLCMYAASCLVI